VQNIAETLWRRRWVVAAVLVFTLLLSPIILTLLKPTYQAEARVALIQDDSGRAPVLAAADLPAVATSLAVLSRVKEELKVPQTIDVMRAHLSVKPDMKSNVIPIDFRDKNPERALKVPNAIADALVDYYRYLATRQYRDLNASLRVQLADQSQKVRSLDARVAKAVEGNSAAASDKAMDTIASGIDALQSQRGAVYATLLADRAAASKAQGAGELQPAINEQAAASDPYYEALRTGQAKDASEYQFEKAGYTDQFPGLSGLREKVSIETSAVGNAQRQAEAKHAGASPVLTQVLMDKRHAETLVAADQARLSAVDGQLQQAQGGLAALSTAGVSADALRLQRDAASVAYQQLFAKLQTSIASEAEASSLSSLFVLDRALASYPRIPAFALALIVSLIIVGAAVGSAYAAEALDPRIRTATDVENVYGASHIGSVH